MIYGLSLQAQLDKKAVRQLEKAARFVPAGTVRISMNESSSSSSGDSLFGSLGPADTNGWAAYYVNLEGAWQAPPINSPLGIRVQPNPSVQIKIENIRMSASEVSNKEYRQFVEWTRIHHPENIQDALVDSQAWLQVGTYNGPIMRYYHSHNAYDNYPAVNISHEQARHYLAWLTEQYNQSPKRKYKKVIFRLPTEAEWMYAWLGGYNSIQASHHESYRNKNGQIVANFRRVMDGEMIKMQHGAFVEFSEPSLNYTNTSIRQQTSPDSLTDTFRYKPNIVLRIGTGSYYGNEGIYTTPSISYWPNPYGLYNMSGNVAEFVQTEGIAKGGHWNTTGFYLMGNSRETYLGEKSASPTRGFRWVMEVIEE